MTVEIGVTMLTYLNQSFSGLQEECRQHGRTMDRVQLRDAVMAGAGLRVRPVMMTTVSTILGLLPVMLGSGTGSEVVSRIAAPMVGGMSSALVFPAGIACGILLVEETKFELNWECLTWRNKTGVRLRQAVSYTGSGTWLDFEGI